MSVINRATSRQPTTSKATVSPGWCISLFSNASVMQNILFALANLCTVHFALLQKHGADPVFFAHREENLLGCIAMLQGCFAQIQYSYLASTVCPTKLVYWAQGRNCCRSDPSKPRVYGLSLNTIQNLYVAGKTLFHRSSCLSVCVLLHSQSLTKPTAVSRRGQIDVESSRRPSEPPKPRFNSWKPSTTAKMPAWNQQESCCRLRDLTPSELEVHYAKLRKYHWLNQKARALNNYYIGLQSYGRRASIYWLFR